MYLRASMYNNLFTQNYYVAYLRILFEEMTKKIDIFYDQPKKKKKKQLRNWRKILF